MSRQKPESISSSLAALFVVVLIGSPLVSAGNMRCGSSLIERGHTFFEVLERCGRPDLEYAWDHEYVDGVQARVTEWVYEQGTNKFRRILTFEEGRLRRIELRQHPKVSLKTLN